MKRISNLWLIPALLMLAITGCVKDDFDEPDNLGCVDANLQRNITIADLKALYNGVAMEIDQDLTIEGVVISSDKEGNFYKELIIQDETAGILILIDQTNTYTNFPAGRKVYLKLQGMYMDDYAGLIQLGASVDAETGDLQRIPQSLVTEFIFKGACNQSVDTLELTPSQLDPDQHQSMLIKLQGMKMDNNDAGVNFADPNGTSSTNRTMNGCNGGSLILRTSDFAGFAGENTPTGSFDVVGVYSVFNSDNQFKINDLMAINESAGGCPCIETTGAVNGTTSFELDDVQIIDDQQQYVVDEDFESVNDNATVALTGWQNISESGTQKWKGDVYQNNTFALVSAFSTGQTDVRTWLITPQVPANSNATMTFRTKDRFDDGAALEVLISTDYDGGSNPENFTWTKICPEIAGGSSGFGVYVPSGLVDLSTYTDAFYVAFRYKGGDN